MTLPELQAEWDEAPARIAVERIRRRPTPPADFWPGMALVCIGFPLLVLAFALVTP